MLHRIGTRFLEAMLILFMLVAPQISKAELSPREKIQAEKMVSGELYLRIDAPCDYGRMVPMLVVSPEGYDATQRIADLSAENLKEVYWHFGPNDVVRGTTLRWGLSSVRLWSEGKNRQRNELMIDFVKIKTIDDFIKTFDLTFSRVPLQNAYPEWAPEVRKAVAEKRVITGMTKEQAAAVVGTPKSVEKSTVEGEEIEIWHPRQGRNAGSVKNAEKFLTHFPATLKFKNGILIAIE
jgi:hypothetical protein